MQGCRTTRAEAPGKPQPNPQQAPRATRNTAPKRPQFAHLASPNLKILFTFAPFGLRKSRENTQPLKRNLNFCPFSAYFSPFCPCCQVLRQSSCPHSLRSSRSAPIVRSRPDGFSPSGTEAHKDRGTKRKGAKRNERKAATSPQAHKKGVPPSYWQSTDAFSLITNSRQKISKKSLGVDLKKFSEKFFGGMFRGKEKPLALSQRKGACLTNENREISNLAMQITKKRTKALLNNRGQR